MGWDPQVFAADDYLVAPADGPEGIDTALLASRDGQPRAVPIIAVGSLDEATASVAAHGGQVVVGPFTVPGLGRACYAIDPTGILFGLHENDPDA